MRLWLSGEGPTDLGQVVPTADGPQFIPGPMAWVVDKLLQARLGYSLLELHAAGADSVTFVHKAQLSAHGKPSQPGKPLLSGIKHGKGHAFHARSAQCLGLMAKAAAPPVVAVLFRDSDGTNATPRQAWREKWESMERGFALAGFDAGVPMVPRPKSEAWLLCGLQQPPYQHCHALEEAPGNDDSPAALKNRLKALIGHEPTADEQAGWVRDGVIDPSQIDMPSLTAFRDALAVAINAACARA